MTRPGSNPLRSAQNRSIVTRHTVELDCCLFLAMAIFTDEVPGVPTLQVIAHKNDKSMVGSWIHDAQTDYSSGCYVWEDPVVSVEQNSLWCFSLEPLTGETADLTTETNSEDKSAVLSPTTKAEKVGNPPWRQFKIECQSVTAVYEFLQPASAPASARSGRSLPALSQRAEIRLGNENFVFFQEIRRLYFEKGIRTPPPSKTVFVSPDLRSCVGPVEWQRRKNENDAPYVAAVEDIEQVCLLPTLRKEQTQVLDKAIAGRTLRILLLDHLPAPCDTIDLRPDSQLLQEQTVAWQDEVLSKDSWPKIDAELSRSELARKFRQHRLQEILSAWQLKQEQNNDLESFLLRTDAAKELLNQATAKAVAEQRGVLEEALADLKEQHALATRQMSDAAQEREIQAADFAQQKSTEDAALAEVRSRLVETKSRLEATQLDLRELQRLAGDARLVAEEKAEEVEAHFLDRIGHLKNRAAEELSALLPIREALGLDQIVVQVTLPPTVAPTVPTLEQITSPGNSSHTKRQMPLRPPFDAQPLGRHSSFDDLTDMLTRLKRGLRDSGGIYWEALAVPVLATMMAGLLPVVAMEESRAFWATVADVIAAGRRLSIYGISESREPLDLFGRLEQNTFYPHAHCLADLLLSSRSTDDLSLVTLENVDALDWNAVMSPLLCLRSEQRPLMLLHPHAAESAGAYAGLVSLPWPSSLLLSGTWSPNSFPPPNAFFRQSILLLSDGPFEEGRARNVGTTSWTGIDWQNAIASTRTVENAEIEAARIEISAKATVPAAAAVRFFRALRSLVANDEARRLMRLHAILPLLVAQGNPPEEIEGAGRETVTALQRLFFGHGAF